MRDDASSTIKFVGRTFRIVLFIKNLLRSSNISPFSFSFDFYAPRCSFFARHDDESTQFFTLFRFFLAVSSARTHAIYLYLYLQFTEHRPPSYSSLNTHANLSNIVYKNIEIIINTCLHSLIQITLVLSV